MLQPLRFLLLLCLLPQLVFAFGKNKVQYEYKHWQYIQSEHFDVYYYQGGLDQAVFTAEVADSVFTLITQRFDWIPPAEQRITILTYQSHNDFTNTNVSDQPQSESVGGFTEFYKGRVVVPFQGSWEDYRHVIHHEVTHALHLAMMYGESILRGAIRFQMPLWYVEGSAEYHSRGGWDRDANMFMADATISGYLPEQIEYLSNYLAYKGGQSVLCYIDHEFGAGKVTELNHRVRSLRNMERALELTLGFGSEELSANWHRYLQEIYWPLIPERDTAADIAEALSDHEQWQNFINTSPAISPGGDRVVFLSNRSGYFELLSVDLRSEKRKVKRLFTAQQSGDFENLHWLRPGLCFNPSGERLCLASKAGAEDALFVLDASDGDKQEELRFGLDGLFSPVWSPDGRYIAFVALEEGHTDLWLYDLQESRVIELMHDRYSDLDPAFSSDGRWLLFASDRAGDLSRDQMHNMSHRKYGSKDIYMMDLSHLGDDGDTADLSVRRVTQSGYDKRSPIWLEGADRSGRLVSGGYGIQNSQYDSVIQAQAEIGFVCDVGGAYNLWTLNAADFVGAEVIQTLPVPRQRTRMLTGLFQPSLAGNGRLAFSSFAQGGYDVFLLKDVGQLPYLGEMPANDLDLLPFNRLQHDDLEVAQEVMHVEERVSDTDDTAWRKFNFNLLERIAEEGWPERADEIDSLAGDTKLDLHAGITPPRLDAEGNYISHPYKVKLSPDVAVAQAQFDNVFGLQGVSQIVFSDLLGNHRIYGYFNVYDRIELANLYAYYQNQAHRVSWTLGGFHNVHHMKGEVANRYYRDRVVGADLIAAYPLNLYTRLSLEGSYSAVLRDSLNSEEVEYDRYNSPIYEKYQRGHFLLGTAAYTFDNILWGSVGPINGHRERLSYTCSIPLAGEESTANEFQSLQLDARRYLRVNNDVQIALRLAGGGSWGPSPQRFFVGGSTNWINAKYWKADTDSTANTLHSDVSDLYYADHIQPLRGAAVYQAQGDHYLLANTELRFTMLRYLVTGWPAQLVLYNLRGALFMDAGTAWYHDGDFDAVDDDGHLEDLLMGYGWGVRANLGVVLIKMDWAWRTTWDGNPDGPQFLFTLGTEF